MLQSIVHEQRTKTQPWRCIHDLRAGRRSHDIRIGDLVVLDSGLHIVRGGDGHRPHRLWLVAGGES